MDDNLSERERCRSQIWISVVPKSRTKETNMCGQCGAAVYKIMRSSRRACRREPNHRVGVIVGRGHETKAGFIQIKHHRHTMQMARYSAEFASSNWISTPGSECRLTISGVNVARRQRGVLHFSHVTIVVAAALNAVQNPPIRTMHGREADT